MKEASKVKQTNKSKQHSTPKAVTFPKKNELPRVGLEHTTLYMYIYRASTRDSSIHTMYIHVLAVMYMYVILPSPAELNIGHNCPTPSET